MPHRSQSLESSRPRNVQRRGFRPPGSVPATTSATLSGRLHPHPPRQQTARGLLLVDYWMGAEPNEDENENGLLTRVRGFVSFSGRVWSAIQLAVHATAAVNGSRTGRALSFVIRPARCASGAIPTIPASRRRDACRNVRGTLGRRAE